MSLHRSAKVSALSLLSLALACSVAGCATSTRDPNPTLKPRPAQNNPLLEAVPIWVSSSATTAGQPVRVWVELSQDASGSGEPIVIQPFILPDTGLPSQNVSDLIDPNQGPLKFQVPVGERRAYTDLVTKSVPSMKEPVIVYLLVTDDKSQTLKVFGSVMLFP